jgi:hypothetical protein
MCLDLAPANMYEGHVVAAHCKTYSIKVPVGLMHQNFTQLNSSSQVYKLDHAITENCEGLIGSSENMCFVSLLCLPSGIPTLSDMLRNLYFILTMCIY